MGNNFTINMEENFKKNQDFITEMNNIKVLNLKIFIKKLLYLIKQNIL